VVNRQPNPILSPRPINRTIELKRHMMNRAVGGEYLEHTAVRPGTETLIRKQHEDNQRRRRISEKEDKAAGVREALKLNVTTEIAATIAPVTGTTFVPLAQANPQAELEQREPIRPRCQCST